MYTLLTWIPLSMETGEKVEDWEIFAEHQIYWMSLETN